MGEAIHSIKATVDPSAAPQRVNQHWCNTVTGKGWMSVGVDSVQDWIPLVKKLRVTTDADLTLQDDQYFVLVTGADPVTITVPDTRGEFDFAVKNNSSAIVTVVKETGNIDGAANVEIPAQVPGSSGSVARFAKQGTEWWAI